MWRTIRSIADERGLSRITLQQVAKREPSVFGDAARKDGGTWLIDDEHPAFIAWFDSHWSQIRVVGSTYIIKAAGPGPSWAEIKRVGISLSDVRDMRNHMLLSDEQENAYQCAFQLVKENKKNEATEVLSPYFDRVWLEE